MKPFITLTGSMQFLSFIIALWLTTLTAAASLAHCLSVMFASALNTLQHVQTWKT